MPCAQKVCSRIFSDFSSTRNKPAFAADSRSLAFAWLSAVARKQPVGGEQRGCITASGDGLGVAQLLAFPTLFPIIRACATNRALICSPKG